MLNIFGTDPGKPFLSDLRVEVRLEKKGKEVVQVFRKDMELTQEVRKQPDNVEIGSFSALTDRRISKDTAQKIRNLKGSVIMLNGSYDDCIEYLKKESMKHLLRRKQIAASGQSSIRISVSC